MDDREEERENEGDFGYMEELSKAYESALARRLSRHDLPEEKRDLLTLMQREILGTAERAYPSMRSEEGRELLLILRESAEECLHILSAKENLPIRGNTPDASLLSHALMLANRSYNILIRHAKETCPLVMLILSELSALYALAAIG